MAHNRRKTIRELTVDEDYLKDFFKDKSVIVLGSAPNLLNTPSTVINAHDIVVRVNNFKLYNECDRADVFYSFFGKSIRTPLQRLKQLNCQLMMCKCPDVPIEVKNRDGSINEKLTDDYGWIYDFRTEWFEQAQIPFFIQTEDNFNENNKMVGQIMTTGVAAIFDIYRYNPKKMYFAGFDFGMSKMHNINKPMIIKPDPNCHHFEEEFNLMKKFHDEHENVECSHDIRQLFKKDFEWCDNG